jgi:ribosomal protein S18 acetylase RimI-like enzyme
VLRVRPAGAADAAALSTLLNQLAGVTVDRAEVADNLGVTHGVKTGVVVAELAEVVGCCAWAIVPTLHRGAIGRLTVLIVDKAHRRRGIGTAMLAAAEKALSKAGCLQVEAMSDITINNSHNFFRSLKFEQTSYRFVRSIDQ